MRTIAALALALVLTACTSTGEPRVGAIIGGVVAGTLLVVASSADDDDEEGPRSQQCTTVISPNPGGVGLGSSSTTCR